MYAEDIGAPLADLAPSFRALQAKAEDVWERNFNAIPDVYTRAKKRIARRTV